MLDDFLQIIKNNVNEINYLPDIVFIVALEESKYEILKIILKYSINYNISNKVINKIILIARSRDSDFFEIIQIFIDFSINIEPVLKIYKNLFLSINEYFNTEYLHKILDNFLEIIKKYPNKIDIEINLLLISISLKEKRYDILEFILTSVRIKDQI